MFYNKEKMNEKSYKIDPDKLSLDSDPDTSFTMTIPIPSQPVTLLGSPFIRITIKNKETIVNINQIQMITIKSIKIDGKWYSISSETYKKLSVLLDITSK
jgi:hypothetical protein